MSRLKLEKELLKIENILKSYKLFFEQNNSKEDNLYTIILEQSALVEKINAKILSSAPPSPCDKIRAKYISEPNISNDPKQIIIIDRRSLLRPSRKAARDPFLARKELLKNLECLNQDKRLERKELTLSISNYLLEQLRRAEEANYPVTFSSKGRGETPKDIVDADGNGVTLFGGHAYTFEKLTNSVVHLYNPHGKAHLKLNMNTLLREFRSASVLALQK